MAYPSFGYPLSSTSMAVSGQHQFFQSPVLGSYGSNNATVNNESNSTTSNGNENSDNVDVSSLSTGNYLVPMHHPCLRPSGGYPLHTVSHPDVSHPGIYGSSLLAYSRPVHGGGLPDPVYRPPTYIAAVASGYRSLAASAVDSAAGVTGVCYPSVTAEATDAWKGVSQSSSGWTYDLSIGGVYPYSTSYGGLDVRRKNATRESTSTLKAWLYEHIKNPYPTKGEKIMLAIITKMTLTQVSTWFANARRRLKKENKMQWSPNKKNDDLDNDDDDGDDDNDAANSNNDDDDDTARLNVADDDSQGPLKNLTMQKAGQEGTTLMTSAKSSSSRLTMTYPVEYSTSFSHSTISSNISSSPSRRIAQNHFDSASKPRIWSLADVATSTDTDKPKSMSVDPPPLTFQRPKFQPWTESAVSDVDGQSEETKSMHHSSSGLLSSFSLPAKDQSQAVSSVYRMYGGQLAVSQQDAVRQPQQALSSIDTSTVEVLVTRVSRSSVTEADDDDVMSNSATGLLFVLKEERKSE